MTLLRPRNILLVLTLLIVVALGITIALRYQAVEEIQQVVEAMPKGVDLALEGIDYTHTENGRALWRLVADRAEHLSDVDLIKVQELELHYFDPDQSRGQVSLRGRSGEVDRDFRRVEVQGDVSVVMEGGYTLQTDTLFFDADSKLIHSPSRVVIIGKRARLQGTGMRLELTRRRIELMADVSAVLNRK